MTQQYDEFADKNSDIERVISLYRNDVEIPSLFSVLGSVHGKRVLDVGCGSGVYARMVKQRGASHVVGVDVSSCMIEVARAIETERPLGVEYHVHDAAAMPVLDAFDVVVAVNVLHYAGSRDVLESMCEQMCANLVSGGRLLACVGNPTCDAKSAEAYGFAVHRPAHPRDEDAYTVFILTDPPVTVRVYYWTCGTLAEVLEKSGFTDVRWETPKSSRAADGSLPIRRTVESPISLLVSARKR
ncbi:MAG: class I SAM-dependent methyltransferase [Pseudonocardiaceae bacterium]